MVDKLNLLNQYKPGRRQIMVDSLNSLVQLLNVTVDQAAVVATTLWGGVTIDAKCCTSCQFCSKFCPTGALQSQLDKSSGTLTITHAPALCVQCGLCSDICQSSAIQLDKEIPAADIAGHAVHQVYTADVANLAAPFMAESVEQIERPAQAIQSMLGNDTTVRLR